MNKVQVEYTYKMNITQSWGNWWPVPQAKPDYRKLADGRYVP